ncbi:hypothetical protein V8C35DRAFT_328124 [Trichoderma chlorosporum]
MGQQQHEPYRRRRPALSCLECRRRKLKCDRSHPCSRCVSTETQCNYRIHQEKPGARHRQTRRMSSSSMPSPPAAHPPSPPSQVDPTRHARTTTTTSNRTASTFGPNDLSHTPGADEMQNPNRPQFVDPELHYLRERVQRLERSLVRVPVQDLSQTGRDVLAGESGMPDARIILNKTRIMRWSHWVGIVKEFAPIISCYGAICGYGDINSFQSTETRALIVEASGLLQKCKTVARNLKMWRPSRCLSSLNFDLTLPSRQVADQMTDLYFQSFESTHRILHEPTFRRVYNRFWSNSETSSAKLRLQVLLVIAIGSSLAPHVESDAGLRHAVHQWIYAAETWLSGPLEKDRLDISGLQIHCLVMLARQIFSIGGDLVWISSGSLIHRAMQIGLHRDPKHLPPMSVLQAQLRRRLWATILELVVQSSLDSALPPRISFDEFDTEPPANSNDTEIGESATELKPHPKKTFTSTSMQLMLLDSLPTRLQALNLLNGLNSELSYLDSFGVTSFHRNLLDYLLRRFLIPLHCPFANKARVNPLFHYSLKISIDTAMTTVSPEPDEGFSKLMAIGGGLFREGIRYATSIISLELLSQVETQYLDGTLHRNSHHLNPLRRVIDEMTSLSLERMRQGETNVKSHMFLSMIMAQAEATGEGVPSEGRIAKSARDSISLCLELLQNRLGTASLSTPTPDAESTSFDEREDYTYGLDFDMDFFLAETSFS